MIPPAIQKLIALKKLDQLSADDQQRLDEWLASDSANTQLLAQILDAPGWKADYQAIQQIRMEAAQEKLWSRIEQAHQQENKVQPFWNWRRGIAIAASLLLFISTILLINKFNQPSIVQGTDQAVLRLADGQELLLRKDQQELIIADSLFYQDGESLHTQYPELEGQQLEIAVPVGSDYTVRLADGSRVKLNATSKLHFPARFSSLERRVQLEGEAYFEITKQKPEGKPVPFIIETKKQQIKVLGTTFNVSAYQNEGIETTTLIEGKVEVAIPGHPDRKQVLNPGYQSRVANEQLEVREVDVYSQVAWTQNQFVFAAEPLASVFRKLGRWYNMSYTFEDPALEKLEIEGILPRFSSIEELLQLLEENGQAKFQVKGNNIHIRKK